MRVKSAAEFPNPVRVKLDKSEKAPALGLGQPLLVVKWGEEGTGDPHLVKLCPDGQTPDFVGGRVPIGASSGGDAIYFAPGAPLLIGGAVSRGEPLKVSGGKFVKAVAKDVAAVAASQAAAADDVIPAGILSAVV